MQLQIHPRFDKRVHCQFQIEDVKHQGMVLNLSQGGLFVSSRAMPEVGDSVAISLTPEAAGVEMLSLETRVVWKQKVNHSRVHLRKGGLGLELARPSFAYQKFMTRVAGLEDLDSPVIRAQALIEREYRVRLSLAGTPRTRSLVVAASDREIARIRAIEKCGEDWTILDIHS